MKTKDFFIDNLIAIILYGAIFTFLLIPFFNDSWKNLAGGLILGIFSAQLNTVIIRLRKLTKEL